MRDMKRCVGAIAALAGATLSGTAAAQAQQCSAPGSWPRVHVEGPSEKEPKRLMPIGGYTLAISWSPQYCATSGRRAAEAFRCAEGGRRFGFTLHGLWPDGTGRDWPQYCRPAAILPRKVVRANLCTTPSAQLIQHEWAKHGTCMTTRPADYFDRSRAMYDRLRFPDMGELARTKGLRAGDFAAAFAAANKGMRADMMRVTATRDGWLDEVWLCLDKRFALARCPAHGGGVRPGTPLKIRL
jgi:ribonuclease T2